MAGLFGVIFVVSGIVGVTMFTKNEVPDFPTYHSNSIVRIAVALNGHGVNTSEPNDGPTQADGTTPAILAYNEMGDYIGWSNWHHRPHIKSGGYVDVVVHQDKGPSQQATYLQLFAGTDAVCIAYISQTWADGQMRGWLGDMGTACGRPTYYSHIFIGNDGHSPDCMWIDADHTNDEEHLKPAAFQIHMQDYTNLTTDYPSLDPSHYCSQECMIFHRETDPSLNFKKGPPAHSTLFTGGGDPEEPCCMKNKKRQQHIQPRSPGLANWLISSPREQHSAVRLCERETSHGPDFVSFSERMFCDMATKFSWPLCEKDESVVEECYDWETHALVTGGKHVAKNYARIEEWE